MGARHAALGTLLLVPAAVLAQPGVDSTKRAAETVAKAAAASPDTSVSVAVSGFVDGYYAYDFNHPRTLDRPYTTQAARHDEFNINLAFVAATLDGPRLRGRFAAQFGTSVQANYAA